MLSQSGCRSFHTLNAWEHTRFSPIMCDLLHCPWWVAFHTTDDHPGVINPRRIRRPKWVTICDNHEQSGNHHGYPWIFMDICIYIYTSSRSSLRSGSKSPAQLVRAVFSLGRRDCSRGTKPSQPQCTMHWSQSWLWMATQPTHHQKHRHIYIYIPYIYNK